MLSNTVLNKNILFNVLPYDCMGLYKITLYSKLVLAQPPHPGKNPVCTTAIAMAVSNRLSDRPQGRVLRVKIEKSNPLPPSGSSVLPCCSATRVTDV